METTNSPLAVCVMDSTPPRERHGETENRNAIRRPYPPMYDISIRFNPVVSPDRTSE